MLHRDFVLSQLNMLLDDSGNARFSADEKDKALIYASTRAWPEWFDVWVDETLAYDGSLVYPLRAGMEDVLTVYIVRDGDARNIAGAWFVESGNLYFQKRFADLVGGTLRIVSLTLPVALSGITAGGVSNTGAVVTFPSGTTLVTRGVRPGMTVRLSGGTPPQTAGDYRIASVDSETQLTLVTSPPVNSGGMTAEVGTKTDMPLSYLVHMAASYLLQHEGSLANNVDTEKQMQWARFHLETALMELRRSPKQMPPRRTK